MEETSAQKVPEMSHRTKRAPRRTDSSSSNRNAHKEKKHFLQMWNLQGSNPYSRETREDAKILYPETKNSLLWKRKEKWVLKHFYYFSKRQKKIKVSWSIWLADCTDGIIPPSLTSFRPFHLTSWHLFSLPQVCLRDLPSDITAEPGKVCSFFFPLAVT